MKCKGVKKGIVMHAISTTWPQVVGLHYPFCEYTKGCWLLFMLLTDIIYLIHLHPPIPHTSTYIILLYIKTHIRQLMQMFIFAIYDCILEACLPYVFALVVIGF
jgi:hypothetical protein